MSPIICGSFAEHDLQLKASYGSSPPYTHTIYRRTHFSVNSFLAELIHSWTNPILLSSSIRGDGKRWQLWIHPRHLCTYTNSSLNSLNFLFQCLCGWQMRAYRFIFNFWAPTRIHRWHNLLLIVELSHWRNLLLIMELSHWRNLLLIVELSHCWHNLLLIVELSHWHNLLRIVELSHCWHNLLLIVELSHWHHLLLIVELSHLDIIYYSLRNSVIVDIIYYSLWNIIYYSLWNIIYYSLWNIIYYSLWNSVIVDLDEFSVEAFIVELNEFSVRLSVWLVWGGYG